MARRGDRLLFAAAALLSRLWRRHRREDAQVNTIQDIFQTCGPAGSRRRRARPPHRHHRRREL